MNERTYRLILGGALAVSLYFDVHKVVLIIISLLFVEGLTNWRVPILLSHLRHRSPGSVLDRSASLFPLKRRKFNFDAERAFRLVFAGVLYLTYVVFNQTLWVLPWFIALSLVAAGLSGFCPMVIILHRLGFR
jgi:hypothetical protein